MTRNASPSLTELLASRYFDAPAPVQLDTGEVVLRGMAGRGSCRSFADRQVPKDLLKTLSAVALAAPTKSDLQQRDIVLLQAAKQRAALAELVGGQAWVADAPVLIVFCGNNRRQRLLHARHGVAFANDHLDALFNAAVDAAIALGTFVTAAEAAGLGCCPISAVRNEAAAVSDLLNLPDHVFPVAGLAVGYPAAPPEMSMRLPLSATYHVDRYSEEGLQDKIKEYDRARADFQPYASQRFTDDFGESPDYTWSEDKVRQYSKPERADFGAFVRAKGFNLE